MAVIVFLLFLILFRLFIFGVVTSLVQQWRVAVVQDLLADWAYFQKVLDESLGEVVLQGIGVCVTVLIFWFR